jgi:hypothetical protein
MLHSQPGVSGEYAALRPPEALQTTAGNILGTGLVETADQSYLGKSGVGIFTDRLREVLAPIEASLKSTGPGLSMAYLVHEHWYTPEMYAHIGGRGKASAPIVSRVGQIANAYEAMLASFAETETRPVLAPQIIPFGTLTKPPYLTQPNTLDENAPPLSSSGCANACFRMTWAALTGEELDHYTVARAMEQTFGSHVVESQRYLNILRSQVFQSRYGPTQAFDIVGADLRAIAQIASGARGKGYDTVVCIVQLSSETSKRSTHQCVLLRADVDNVVLHDPSATYGASTRAMPKAEFARRWAIGLNQALIVVSRQLG